MLKRLVVSVLFSVLVGAGVAFCDGNGRVPPRPVQNLDPSQITIEMIVEPRSPLSNEWAFVVDTSSSLWSIFGRIRGSFLESTQFPTDELHFCAITFNDRSMHKFRDWVPSSVDELAAADAWIARNRGVLSYGGPALEMALRQNRQKLTVILITDGGFTEACYNRGFGSIRNIINDGQAWRRGQNLDPALICCIGIQNPNYTAGGKPSDIDCQAFLQEIGTDNGGGYFLVKGAAAHAQGPSRNR